MRKTGGTAFILLTLFYLLAGRAVPVYAQGTLALHFSASQTSAATNDSITFDLAFSGEDDVAAFDMALAIAPQFAFEAVTAVGMPAADLSYYFREDKLNILYLDNTGGLNPAKPGSVLIQIRVRALAQTGASAEVFTLSTYNFSGIGSSGEVVTFPAAVTQDAVQVSSGNAITAEDVSLPATATVIDGVEDVSLPQGAGQPASSSQYTGSSPPGNASVSEQTGSGAPNSSLGVAESTGTSSSVSTQGSSTSGGGSNSAGAVGSGDGSPHTSYSVWITVGIILLVGAVGLVVGCRKRVQKKRMNSRYHRK